VCGVFGATAAAARLGNLDAHATANALGIAGSMASGLLEFLADGSDTKRLHPGWAAHAGVMAARLAAHGATGPASILEGRRGFFATYLHGIDADLDRLADTGERWRTTEIAFKPYPACHYVTAPVDSLAEILRGQPLAPEEVESLVALSDTTGVGLVLDPPEDKVRPRTPYDAKFSLPYCLAQLLVHGSVDVASFTSQAIGDPAVLAVTPRVGYELKEYAPAPDAFPGGVRLRTRDGRTFEAEFRHQRGSAQNPIEVDDVRAKYRTNAALALPAESVDGLEAAILGLEREADLRALAVLREARAREPARV
jgi:2-methylcitrate dehydratase PrpD